MGEIVIEKINYKAYILLFFNMVAMIAAIGAVCYGFGEHKARYWVPGMIFVISLFFTLIAAIVNSLQIKRLITITRDGLIDNSSISGVGYISFDEIKEFIIVSVNYKKSIAVIPKNIDSFLSKLSVVKRSLAKRNMNANLPPIMIPIDLAKDMEPEDILSLLKKRLSDYSSLDE